MTKLETILADLICSGRDFCIQTSHDKGFYSVVLKNPTRYFHSDKLSDVIDFISKEIPKEDDFEDEDFDL